jgi:hypothetical protein
VLTLLSHPRTSDAVAALVSALVTRSGSEASALLPIWNSLIASYDIRSFATLQLPPLDASVRSRIIASIGALALPSSLTTFLESVAVIHPCQRGTVADLLLSTLICILRESAMLDPQWFSRHTLHASLDPNDETTIRLVANALMLDGTPVSWKHLPDVRHASSPSGRPLLDLVCQHNIDYAQWLSVYVAILQAMHHRLTRTTAGL